MNKTFALSLSFITAVTFSGCAIKRDASPVSAGTEISEIYVQRNPQVHMEGLFDEIITQLDLMGFQVQGFEGAIPGQAEFVLTYTANWRWDMAMYLTYFRANLHKQDNLLGTAEYDARMGGMRLDKFGKTSEKIRPALTELLKAAKPLPKAPMLGSN